MDMTAWLLRRTPIRPLIVATRGGTAGRVEAERLARVWGWREAFSPAEANMLVVTGPGGQDLAPFVDTVWQAMPIPKIKVDIAAAEETEGLLASAVVDFKDPQQQRAHVDEGHEVGHAASHASSGGHAGHDMHSDHEVPADHRAHADHEGHSGHDMATEDHVADGHDMHGGHHAHGDHDMSGMEMPGGIPMADRADDRDGLKLDVLHVPLGPVLPDWPPGLVVHTVAQGDVLQDVSVELIGSTHGPWAAPLRAKRLDSCARLLAVAGWYQAATVARRLRDEVLADQVGVRELERWARRVQRSRVLRWSLVGLGEWNQADAADRLSQWIDQALDNDGPVVDPAVTQAILDDLPGLLEGTELAGARLVVASLDPDTEQVDSHG
jgi:hypothetical protein